MKSRIISGSIAAVYLVAAYLTGKGEAAFQVGLFLIFPLACIWFSDAMGGFTGLRIGGPSITSTTPGWVVAFGGWLLLLLPVVIGLIMTVAGNR
jgi:CDP-diglyceride synthetase